MRKRIRKLYASAKKPLRRLRLWARQPKGTKGRHKRFSALASFAKSRIKLARKKANPKRVKVWVRERKHYRAKKRYLKKQIDKGKRPASGVGTFDGKPVAAWWVPILAKARATGLWKGSLQSGWRSPEYSEGLCIQICGAPQCPGRCAGRASAHVRTDEHAPVDVSDPAGFARAMAKLGLPYKNTLGAADPWHYSLTGA